MTPAPDAAWVALIAVPLGSALFAGVRARSIAADQSAPPGAPPIAPAATALTAALAVWCLWGSGPESRTLWPWLDSGLITAPAALTMDPLTRGLLAAVVALTVVAQLVVARVRGAGAHAVNVALAGLVLMALAKSLLGILVGWGVVGLALNWAEPNPAPEDRWRRSDDRLLLHMAGLLSLQLAAFVLCYYALGDLDLGRLPLLCETGGALSNAANRATAGWVAALLGVGAGTGAAQLLLPGRGAPTQRWVPLATGVAATVLLVRTWPVFRAAMPPLELVAWSAGGMALPVAATQAGRRLARHRRAAGPKRGEGHGERSPGPRRGGSPQVPGAHESGVHLAIPSPSEPATADLRRNVEPGWRVDDIAALLGLLALAALAWLK